MSRNPLVAIILAGIVTMCFIGLYYSFSGNPHHAYGERVGSVIAPGEDECAFNGQYYPVSSGKCNMTPPAGFIYSGTGGAGGYVNVTGKGGCAVDDPYNPGGAFMVPCDEVQNYTVIKTYSGSRLYHKDSAFPYGSSGGEGYSVSGRDGINTVSCNESLKIDGYYQIACDNGTTIEKWNKSNISEWVYPASWKPTIMGG